MLESEDFSVVHLDEFQQIPFVNKMGWFHFFFFIIMIVSIARVSINIMIFSASVKDVQGTIFLKYESYAIFTELGSCLILWIYYRSVTQKNTPKPLTQVSKGVNTETMTEDLADTIRSLDNRDPMAEQEDPFAIRSIGL